MLELIFGEYVEKWEIWTRNFGVLAEFSLVDVAKSMKFEMGFAGNFDWIIVLDDFWESLRG